MEVRKRKIKPVCSGMRMESRKMVLMSLFAKQLGGADIKTRRVDRRGRRSGTS